MSNLGWTNGTSMFVPTIIILQNISVFIMIHICHRGIHDALEEEKRSLNQRRAYFHEKERSLRKRQEDYKQAHMELKSQKQRQVSEHVVLVMGYVADTVSMESILIRFLSCFSFFAAATP